jgi:hypothetical protein
MSHNPYSPPAANVADAPPPPRGERPRAVKIALALLWLGMGLAIVIQLVDVHDPARGLNMGLVIGSQVVGIALNVWLFVKIGAGRNWARIVYVVLIGLSLPIQGFAIKLIFTRSMLIGLMVAASVITNIVAMVLVFGPGRAWFRNAAR